MRGATTHRVRTPASIDGAGMPVRCVNCGGVFRLTGEFKETADCPKCKLPTPTVQERRTTDG